MNKSTYGSSSLQFRRNLFLYILFHDLYLPFYNLVLLNEFNHGTKILIVNVSISGK